MLYDDDEMPDLLRGSNHAARKLVNRRASLSN